MQLQNWRTFFLLRTVLPFAASLDSERIQFKPRSLKSLQHSHFMIKILIELLFFSLCSGLDACEREELDFIDWKKKSRTAAEIESSPVPSPHQKAHTPVFRYVCLIANLFYKFSLIKIGLCARSHRAVQRIGLDGRAQRIIGTRKFWKSKKKKSCWHWPILNDYVVVFVSAVLSLLNSLNNVVIYIRSPFVAPLLLFRCFLSHFCSCSNISQIKFRNKIKTEHKKAATQTEKLNKIAHNNFCQ